MINRTFWACIQRHLLSFVLAIVFLSDFAQTKAQVVQPLTPSEQVRINQLFAQVQSLVKVVIPLPGPCPLSALPQTSKHQSKIIAKWLKQIPIRLQQGDSLCAFRMLDALLPSAKQDPDTYRQWLLTHIHVLIPVGQLQQALTVIDQLAQLSVADKQMQGWAIYEKGRVLNRLIQFEKALQAGNEALAIARSQNEPLLEVDALNLIGLTSRDIYRQVPSKYLPYLQQALALAISLNDTTRIIDTYQNLAYAHFYDETADIDAVLEHLEKCIPYLTARQDLVSRFRFVWAVADGLSYFPETQAKASQLYRQLLPMANTLRRTNDRRTLYHYLGALSVSNKRYREAAAYLDSAARYDTPDWEKDHFYQEQAVVQEALGNLALANQYYQKALAEKERVYLRRNNQSMTEWETRFRTREKELLITEQKNRQWWLLGIVGLLILLFGISIFAFFRNRQQIRLLVHQKAIIEQQSRELQRLDEAKTRFFSNITHEFRTPLTLILSPLAGLIDQLPQFSALKTMQVNANRLLTFINQLLDLSKLDAGLLRPSFHTENLAAFLLQQEESFRGLAEHRQIHLSFTQLPAHTEASFDADKLGKILTNLISNAIKFTPASGSVQVQVALESADTKTDLSIQVSDTGLGIAPEQLPYIFNRFYQVNDTSTRHVTGSGIGLSLVKELVDVLQGDIQVTSTVGQGTQFSLRLPLGEQTQNVSDYPPLPQPYMTLDFQPIPPGYTANEPVTSLIAGVNEKAMLLIVEDNDDLRAYIARLFSSDYQVSTAANGHEGLVKAFDLVPDLVITDWMMPGMDGIEFCQQLKSDIRTSHVPVLMLTAKSAPESRLDSLGSGADDHITKPFNERELRLKVRNWLDRQQRLRQHYQQQQTQPNDVLPLPEGDSGFMERLLGLVDNHMTDSGFGVEQLADTLALSRRTLHRKVVSLTGMSPIEVIRNHRLRRALPYLKQGRPIADVAFIVGFETPSYFSKCFQELFGQKPSEVN